MLSQYSDSHTNTCDNIHEVPRQPIHKTLIILLVFQITAYTTFFHVPATLLSFPGCILPHLSLVQSPELKSFNPS